jgi:hypothetical protein
VNFGQKVSNLLSKSGAISSIYYDGIKNHFLITVFHEIPEEEIEIDYKFAPFSVIITDSNFNTISETEFVDGNYSCSNLLYTKTGIYILHKNESNNETFTYHAIDF